MPTNPKTPNRISGGLKKLPADSRDFSVGAIYAPVDVSEIPDDFSLGKLKVKDQGNSDFCGAFATTSASELQEGVELNPLWQFAQIKKLMGEWESWGADLRQACASLVKAGSIREGLDEVLPTMESPRDTIANWKNWPDLSDEANKFRKQSYFSVSKGGYKDLFDAIQGEMWRNRESKRGVIVGALWRPEWITAENGVISQEYGKEGFGHAFLFTGKKTIDGVPYLVAHLSNGDIGDNGEFYFSRAVVNKEIGKYGVFMYQDMDTAYYKKNVWSLWQRLADFLKKLL